MVKNILVFIVWLMWVFPLGANAIERLHPEVDFSYLGAFRVPVDSSSNYSWGWVSNHGLSFRASGDPTGGGDGFTGSLISPPMRVASHANFGKITEFSIPSPVVSPTKSLGDLNVAKTIQDWSDVTEGKFDQGQGGTMLLSSVLFVPKTGTQLADKIYWLTTSWYQPKLNFPSLGMSDIDFSNPEAKGPWVISGSWAPDPIPSAKTSEYLLQIPQNWADQYVNGYSLGVGANKPNNGGSRGACLFAVKPWGLDQPPWVAHPVGSATPVPTESKIDSKELLCPGVEMAHRRNYDGSLWEEFSYSDGQLDAVWIDNGINGAIVFSGQAAALPGRDIGVCDLTKGDICEYYKIDNPGDGDKMNPPLEACTTGCTPSPDACLDPFTHDYRGEPYQRVLWFYDVNDVTAVAKGLKEPWEPQPYAVFNLDNYFFDHGRCVNDYIGGITYDSVNKLIYIAELYTDSSVSRSDKSPIVHVFRVKDVAGSPDVVPPPKVSGLNVVDVDGDKHLSWSASNDDIGPVLYVVLRNGKPIVMTPYTTFIDTKASLFVPPYAYSVEVRDAVNNKTLEIQRPLINRILIQ